jgi:spermidine synthase
VWSLDIEIVAYEPSPIGMICLQRREILSSPGTFVTEITLDHQFLMSSVVTDSERALATRAIELHGGTDLDVLVGGLGLGYTAHAALESHHVARVEVVELLPQVISWLDRDLVPLSAALKAETRLEITLGDVYRRLAGPPTSRSDLILVDVDTSPERRLGEVSALFYTDAGLERSKRHLAPGGVLAVWSFADSEDLEAGLRRVFDDVIVEPITFYNAVLDEEETNWLFFARTRAGDTGI